jgi:hypothetical protein
MLIEVWLAATACMVDSMMKKGVLSKFTGSDGSC